MKIICFAGGTLGHIMPCVILIREIKKRFNDVYIVFVGTSKDQHYKLLHDKNIDKSYYLESSKLSFSVKQQLTNLYAFKTIKKIIKDEKIDIAYGFGGYISGIGILAAELLKLKTYIHEQNSVMGKANKYLARFVDTVFLSYPLKEMKKNYQLVGNPVYQNAVKVKKDIYKIKNKLLFTSGTLGARTINMLAVNLINSGYLNEYDIYIITGKKYYDDVKKILLDTKVKILPFSNNLINEIASSDIVVSRGGSSTLFEIIGTKTISIIIPSPNVTDNHQYYNARYFKEMGCIEMIEEKDLSINNFIHTINLLKVDKEEYINKMNQYCSKDIYKQMIDGVLDA